MRGDAGCCLRLHSDKNQYVRLAFHSGVTSRMSDYAPPDTVGIKFVISCCRISAINRRRSLNGAVKIYAQNCLQAPAE